MHLLTVVQIQDWLQLKRIKSEVLSPRHSYTVRGVCLVLINNDMAATLAIPESLVDKPLASTKHRLIDTRK